jgi:hypothetical protein
VRAWLPHLAELGVPPEVMRVVQEVASFDGVAEAAQRLGVDQGSVGSARKKLDEHLFELVRQRDLRRAVRQLMGIDLREFIKKIRAHYEGEALEREQAVHDLVAGVSDGQRSLHD